MPSPEPSCLPAVEVIFAEMIDRRAVLTPIIEDAWDKALAVTPRRKLKSLVRRLYTPLNQRHGNQRQRLWRMKAGLYDLVCFDKVCRQVTLQMAGSSRRVKVRLPRRMEWPWKATHLRIGWPGEDPSYPRGKAEWVRL